MKSVRTLYQQLLDYYIDIKKEDESSLKSFLEQEIHPIIYHKRKDGVAKSFKKSRYSDDENKSGRNSHYYQYITVLHCIFKIPLSVFDLPDNDILRKKLKGLNQSYIEIHQLKHLEKDRQDNVVKRREYFQASKNFLNYLDGNCFVYDHLQRFSKDIYLDDPYIECHDDIFEVIEDKLFNKGEETTTNFDYARFLALPIGLCHYSPQQVFDEVKMTKEIIEHISLALFKHICRCLSQYPDYETPDSYAPHTNRYNYHYGFYMVGMPTRECHYSIINDAKYCLSEYYRYSKWGVYKPDLLLIENNEGEVHKLASIYKKEIDDLFSSLRHPKMKMENIVNVIKKLEEDLTTSNIDKAKVSFFKDNYGSHL